VHALHGRVREWLAGGRACGSSMVVRMRVACRTSGVRLWTCTWSDLGAREAAAAAPAAMHERPRAS
jgi:hypothetical protein